MIERLLELPDSGLVVSVHVLRLEPDFAAIRDDARFQALLKKYSGDRDDRT